MKISTLIGWNNNEKGDFVERFLYDYYESLGEFYNYNPTLIMVSEDGKQRFGEKNDMVMPDIFVNDSENNNMFFVESKSRFNPREKDVYFQMSLSLESDYKRFYKRIFPSKTLQYENFIPTTIVFSIVTHNDWSWGKMKSYFMPMTSLGEIERQEGKNEAGVRCLFLKESNIEKFSYNIFEFPFYMNHADNTINTDFCDDFFHKERYSNFVTEESMKYDLQNLIGIYS